MAIIHVSITITGNVQGVFFRASTKQKADELGLNGFVRNEADGSVYLEAEGEETAIQQLIEWCRTGPPARRSSTWKWQKGVGKDLRASNYGAGK